MKTLIVALIGLIGLTLAVPAAEAKDKHHHDKHHRHSHHHDRDSRRHHHHHRHHWNDSYGRWNDPYRTDRWGDPYR